MPGLSPLTISEAAAEAVRKRNRKVQSWFMDLNLVMGYWGEGAPGNLVRIPGGRRT